MGNPVANGTGGHHSSVNSTTFPDRPQFSRFMKPCRVEGEVENLEVVGSIPESIDGTFYRVMPDPQLPPFIENDAWFNGNGNVSAFRIKDGNVHFKQHYVRTEKFQRERKAQKALIGKYRNKYTDAVEFKIRTIANTNVVHWNGKLLALKEDVPPYAMDAESLETIGLWDFDGQLPSVTFTAHPRFDPVTNEMVLFWLCDLERMKAGGEHWEWSPETPFYLRVLPRHGAQGTDVKWFTFPNSFPGHTLNAYENPSGKIILDFPLSEKHVFFGWPDAQGRAPNPHEIFSKMAHFEFDTHADKLNLPEPSVLVLDDREFPRVDDRFATKQHNHAFYCAMIPQLGTDFAAIGPVMGGGFPPYNALGHLNVKTREKEV